MADMFDDSQNGQMLFPEPKIPLELTGEQVFDVIMGAIEPELTSAEVNLLTEKYANETPEEKEAREERYNRAYEEYDRRFALFQKALDEKANAIHREAMHSVEANDRAAEQNDLANIEASLSTDLAA